jgi:hypothetical protein
MKTKEVEIEFNGSKGIVRIKRLNYGEKNKLEEEATDVKIMGGEPIVRVSMSKLKELALLKSITDAPFPINLNNIQALEQEIGDELFLAYSEINGVSKKKLEN